MLKSISLLLLLPLSALLNSLYGQCPSTVLTVGTLRQTMREGKTNSLIHLDTVISNNLIGVGPREGLTGEITVVKGVAYVSTIDDEGRLAVEQASDVGAPFFVYADVHEWVSTLLRKSVNSIPELDSTLAEVLKRAKVSTECSTPMLVKGEFAQVDFHVFDKSSRKKLYIEQNVKGYLVIFYSTRHHGIFTHHDSNSHIHFIAEDKSKMGHVDDVKFDKALVTVEVPLKK